MKLYTAGNMQEAMAQVKSDLGRDAVILHTRRFRKGGLLGFFAKEMVEVMAAVDTVQVAAPPVEKKTVRPPAMNLGIQGEEEPKLTALQLEMANMRKVMEQVLNRIPKLDKQVSPLFDLLIKNDVDAKIAENLLQGLTDETSFIANDTDIMQRLLLERISNYLQKIEGIHIPAGTCKTVAFIGPTGVGKTTTIAKLAANFAIKEGYRVALVTADTYRVAAVDQLKTYADIIGVPIEIVYSPDELKAALFRHRDKDLVLVDTAGRSPRNPYHLNELQTLLSMEANMEVHLVLSTTTKYTDILEIIDKFSVCSPQKLLFTKIDEATNFGTIFNVLYQFPIPLSYLTTGQNVPDDIELAHPNKLANLILRA